MAEITLYNYIAAVLAFTLIPINGENVTCKNDDSILVGEQCYIPNFARLQWTEARDQCVKWNGQLATFTSLDHVRETFTALVSINKDALRKWDSVLFWVGAQKETEELGLQWTAIHTMEADAFRVYFQSCNLLSFPSICTENNNKPVNDLNSKATTNATTQVDLTNKERNALTTTRKNDFCLHNDSVPVDGLCYRLSTDSFKWSNASNYCNSLNGTVATISSVGQGIKVLTAMKLFNNATWITDSFKSQKGKLIKLSEKAGCKEYYYGNVFLSNFSRQVLCLEMPITNSDSNNIPVLTTTQTLITKPKLTTKPVTTSSPESMTASKSITPTHGQDKLGNRNGLINLNLLLNTILF